MPVLVFTTFITPPIPTIGAYKTMRSSITDTICTCWISLVLLVIREAVENRSISVSEKDTTLWNTLFRKFLPIFAEVRADRKPAAIAAAIISMDSPNIIPPFPSRYFVCTEAISIPNT